jgi:hypothetical protein
MLVVILTLTWFGGKPEETTRDKLLLLFGGAVVFGGIGLLYFLVMRIVTRLMGTRFRGTIGPHVFEITEEGITESNADGKTETRMHGIRRIDETREHFFIITKGGVGHVIPKREFPELEPIRSLRNKVGRAEPPAGGNAG